MQVTIELDSYNQQSSSWDTKGFAHFLMVAIDATEGKPIRVHSLVATSSNEKHHNFLGSLQNEKRRSSKEPEYLISILLYCPVTELWFVASINHR